MQGGQRSDTCIQVVVGGAVVALGGGVISTPFVKGYNEKIFEIVRVVKVAQTVVPWAQTNIWELKFSLFAHRTTFFAAK